MDRAGRPGQQERAGFGPGVDGAADAVPDGRHALPLVQEDRAGAVKQSVRCGLSDRPLGRVVEPVDGRGALERRLGLADPLGPFEGDGGEGRRELVELVVDDAAEVGHGRGGGTAKLRTRDRQDYNHAACYATDLHSCSANRCGS